MMKPKYIEVSSFEQNGHRVRFYDSNGNSIDSWFIHVASLFPKNPVTRKRINDGFSLIGAQISTNSEG